MEAIFCLPPGSLISPLSLRPSLRRTTSFQPPSAGPLVRLSYASSKEAYKGLRPRRDLVSDWVACNDGLVRSLPIYVGGLSLLVVLLNRTVSCIALVTDASRAWESFSWTTCCRSLVIIYGEDCFLQIGIAAESPIDNSVAMAVDVHNLLQGSLCKSAMGSRKHIMFVHSGESYLANLSLYPERSELPFLPSNTQPVILQPLGGDKGIAIIGGDTIRGFTSLDQAWITLIAKKLDATLSKF